MTQSAPRPQMQPLLSGPARIGMSTNVRDIIIRAAKTALQAGLSVVVAAGTGYIDIQVWKVAGIAAGAAFFSALQNALTTAVRGE